MDKLTGIVSNLRWSHEPAQDALQLFYRRKQNRLTFLLDGNPVRLTMKHEIFIAEGDLIALTGKTGSDHIFYANAYRNFTSRAIGKPELQLSAKGLALLWPSLILALSALWQVVNFLITFGLISFTDSFVMVCLLAATGFGLLSALVYRNVSKQKRAMQEEIEQLLNEELAIPPTLLDSAKFNLVNAPTIMWQPGLEAEAHTSSRTDKHSFE